jgi:hypothetical protein
VNRRPRRGVPAALIGLLLLAASVLAATDAIQILAGHHPMLSYTKFAATLHRQHWNSLAPAITAGCLILAGLLLLLAALLPGRPVVLALDSAAPAASADEAVLTDGAAPTAGLSRRGFRNMLHATAASVDGVTSASLAVHRKVIAATVHTTGPAEGLADSVRVALERRLDQIAPARRPALRVRASTRSSS